MYNYKEFVVDIHGTDHKAETWNQVYELLGLTESAFNALTTHVADDGVGHEQIVVADDDDVIAIVDAYYDSDET